ncbi:MAG TPA: acyl-CoA dehydrogenase family protein [Nocardioidaceae bacterium]|nr:acyl-CoA dehydrogenase family protein [Nocardioidaceae bacterium]
MDFTPSPRAADLTGRVKKFVAEHIEPIEADYRRQILSLRESGGDAWTPLPVIAELQSQARSQGLWNLFLPKQHAGEYAERFGTDGGEGLSNLDYAPVAEQMGRSFLAPLVFNCNAPDTGNMEVLLRYGDETQRKTWLEPLLEARIRSAFTMTEPGVASSDATNMAATAVIDPSTGPLRGASSLGSSGQAGQAAEVVINGRKWWSSGAGNRDCAIFVFMGLADPRADADTDRHSRHTMVLVPRDTEGVRIERTLSTMNLYDEPLGHAEITFTDVRVPASNILLGPGRAFEIAQGRLGPGRVHHCMRLIGLAERCLELACRRGLERVAFGRPLAKLGGNSERIAEARIAIDQARLLVLHAAWKLDEYGPQGALAEVSAIKVAVPSMAQRVIDMAIQMHGGAGMSGDFPLAEAWTSARSLRLADGPDEVHRGVVARLELGKYR